MSFFSSEWTYLLTTRIVAGNDSAFSYVRLKYGSNLTDTVTGVIIYPDDFSFAEAGVGALNFGANYAITQIDAATWEALEDMGCVFLPGTSWLQFSSGMPTINETVYCQQFYWSATANSADKAKELFMKAAEKTFNADASYLRYGGLGVRLVQDL